MPVGYGVEPEAGTELGEEDCIDWLTEEVRLTGTLIDIVPTSVVVPPLVEVSLLTGNGAVSVVNIDTEFVSGPLETDWFPWVVMETTDDPETLGTTVPWLVNTVLLPVG